MKLYKFLLMLFVLVILRTSSYSQKIADADLQRYVIAMDSIEILKNQLNEKMKALAKGNEKISASRYAELIGKANDMAKLGEAKANPDEIAYVKQAALVQQEETRKFQKAYHSLISDYVGDSTFGKIRFSLQSDTVLRKKFDSMMAARKN